MSSLLITIPDKQNFYSLYAEGIFLHKTFDKDSQSSIFTYSENALVVLYHTYPAYKEACVVRNNSGNKLLPVLSKKVSLLDLTKLIRKKHSRPRSYLT